MAFIRIIILSDLLLLIHHKSDNFYKMKTNERDGGQNVSYLVLFFISKSFVYLLRVFDASYQFENLCLAPIVPC